MPGAYAHITAVMAAAENLEAVIGLPPAVIPLILEHLEFVQLGALGPDYPYLDKFHLDDKRWADAMHYDDTGDRIRVGMGIVARMQDVDKQRALAWLLGFTGHVVADVTIHPVVELKVGPYEGNEKEHRICEMHQDVYIFSTRSGIDFNRGEFLKKISALCTASDHPDNIHPAVKYVWDQMFQRTDQPLYLRNQYHIDAWHACFRALVAGITDDRLFALARHVAPWLDGYIYPLFEDVDRAQYIDTLNVPGGGAMSYDEVFDRAVANIRSAWAVVASDVLGGSALAGSFLRDWNLDTGKDKQTNMQTFWS